MTTKIAINGFGRIGRNAFKIAFSRNDLEVVAVNDLTDTKTLAHLLKHDSNYGTYQNEVSFDDENIIVDGKKIKVLAEKDPAALPWKDLGVDIVIESTGLFVDPEKAKAHVTAGAKKVILSAPAKGEGANTVVIGVNEDQLPQTGDVISNASCTTNCITPVMAILEASFGIEKAMMTTVHSYTASQRLQDAPAKDLREARNAATNIVPTTTGASIAAAKAMPALEGIFGGMSVRVPTPVVSLSDFVVVTKRDVTVDEVNEAFKKAADEPYFQGIVTVTEEELVSTDFIGNSHSAIVDLKLTAVVGGNLLKVVAWYDNEWGYSNRLVELTADAGKHLNGDAPAGPSPDGPSNDDSSEGGAPHLPLEDDKTDETDTDSPPKDKELDLMKEPDEPLLQPPHEAGHEHTSLESDPLEHSPAAFNFNEPPKPEEHSSTMGSPDSTPSNTEDDKPDNGSTDTGSEPIHRY